MPYAIAYLATLLPFMALDALWLGSMASLIYRPTLGDILLADLKLAPAAAFYLMFPIGLVAFAVAPALKSDSLMMALGFGALFGALAYATYDLTNFATLRNWTLQITVIDILWGAFASGVASVIGYGATKAAGAWL